MGISEGRWNRSRGSLGLRDEYVGLILLFSPLLFGFIRKCLQRKKSSALAACITRDKAWLEPWASLAGSSLSAAAPATKEKCKEHIAAVHKTPSDIPLLLERQTPPPPPTGLPQSSCCLLSFLHLPSSQHPLPSLVFKCAWCVPGRSAHLAAPSPPADCLSSSSSHPRGPLRGPPIIPPWVFPPTPSTAPER